LKYRIAKLKKLTSTKYCFSERALAYMALDNLSNSKRKKSQVVQREATFSFSSLDFEINPLLITGTAKVMQRTKFDTL
jgi:hypothetical protein